MPFLNHAERLSYSRQWIARRRAEWFAANGPCRGCGSSDRLELDHVDPAQKVSHRIWTWSAARREAELAKCQPLCHDCHRAKTRAQKASTAPCGTRARYKAGCKCGACRGANYAYVQAQRATARGCRSC